MKMVSKVSLILVCGLSVVSLTGCASIVNGTQQPVTVSTTPVHGAKCVLVNNKGQWVVASTPSTVTVHRSYDALHVVCSKPGYKSANKIVVSKTKAMAFGNIIFGGGIGAGIDAANGAAYDYPEDIQVNMLS